jgi:hypothetical protein
VDLGERRRQVEPERAATGSSSQRAAVAHDDALDALHQVERRTDHADVLADRDRRGTRTAHSDAGEQVEHAVLAHHVVRRRQQRAGRRAPQHPLRGPPRRRTSGCCAPRRAAATVTVVGPSAAGEPARQSAASTSARATCGAGPGHP